MPYGRRLTPLARLIVAGVAFVVMLIVVAVVFFVVVVSTGVNSGAEVSNPPASVQTVQPSPSAVTGGWTYGD